MISDVLYVHEGRSERKSSAQTKKVLFVCVSVWSMQHTPAQPERVHRPLRAGRRQDTFATDSGRGAHVSDHRPVGLGLLVLFWTRRAVAERSAPLERPPRSAIPTSLASALGSWLDGLPRPPRPVCPPPRPVGPPPRPVGPPPRIFASRLAACASLGRPTSARHLRSSGGISLSFLPRYASSASRRAGACVYGSP